MINSKKVVITIFILLVFPVVVFSVEGEVSKGEAEIVVESQDIELKGRPNDEEKVIIGGSFSEEVRAPKGAQLAVGDKEINTIIDQFRNTINERIRNELKNMLYREFKKIHSRLTYKKEYLANPIDREINIELNRLFKALKLDLTSKMRKQIRANIVVILQNYIRKYNLKVHKKVNKKLSTKYIGKTTKKARSRAALRSKMPMKKGLYISNIIVGSDIAKGQQVGKGKGLAIVVTTIANQAVRDGKLYIYARNIKTNMRYLIYSLDPFRIDRRWAQDQLIWNGSYYKNAKVSKLPKGLYRIYCLVSYREANKKKKNNIGRFWGGSSKRYYIMVN